jgi:putative DNA primase/helicase
MAQPVLSGLPPLMGTVHTPTLRPDGSVLCNPGYDNATGLLYVPSQDFPRIPGVPSAADARAALRVLREPLSDFPFVGPSDGAAAVAAMLTILARSAFPCAPLFPVDATTPGTGKTLCVRTVALAATGRDPSFCSVPASEEEWRKRILALAIAGDPVILLDNVEQMLASASLALALTSTTFRDRVLGATKWVSAPLNTTFFATGNGLSFSGDLSRRAVPIRLNARTENPENRSGFKHKDLIAHVKKNVPSLVAAGLTLLRAYFVAGRPAHGATRMGSFEAWDDTVRGAVIWAGMADPCEGREAVRRENDRDRDALRALLAAWDRLFGDTPVTASDVAHAANGDADLRDTLIELMPPGRSVREFTGRSVGYVLRKYRDRVVDGQSLSSRGQSPRRVALWGLTCLDTHLRICRG